MHVFQLEKATEKQKIYQQYYVFTRSTAGRTAFSKDSGMENFTTTEPQECYKSKPAQLENSSVKSNITILSEALSKYTRFKLLGTLRILIPRKA